MSTAIYNPNPSSYRSYNWLVGLNESDKPKIKHKPKIKDVVKHLSEKNYECPICGSSNIKRFFVDGDLKEIAPNADETTWEGKCKDCNHEDELYYFTK